MEPSYIQKNCFFHFNKWQKKKQGQGESTQEVREKMVSFLIKKGKCHVDQIKEKLKGMSSQTQSSPAYRCQYMHVDVVHFKCLRSACKM